jgi:hypothetical protein
MPFTSNITKARIAAKLIYIAAPARQHLAHGRVSIHFPCGIVLDGVVKPFDGHPSMIVHCPQAYLNNRVCRMLPLRLGDRVDYDILQDNIQILAIIRGGVDGLACPGAQPGPRKPSPRGARSGGSKSNTRPLKQLATNFIDQLKARNKVDLLPWDKRRWFRGAYSTIQRTLRGGFSPLSTKQKCDCADLLSREIPALAGREFDLKLKSLVHRTADEFKLSVGHAQKLISILTKYATACHMHSSLSVPEGWRSLVDSNFDHLPVPVDAIVLFQLRILYPNHFPDVLPFSGKDKNGRPTHWAKILSGNTAVSWSRISDYNTYWSLQVRIRELAEANKVAPHEFEMRYLWLAE